MEDGTVAIVGGSQVYNTNKYPSGYSAYLSSCRHFNPTTNRVTQCPSLKIARAGAVSAVLDGTLYVCGGYGSGDRPGTWSSATEGIKLRTCERLISDGWEMTVELNGDYGDIVAFNGHLYAIGGGNDSRLVDKRRSSGSHWTSVKSLNEPRDDGSAVAMGPNLFVCGGSRSREIASCEKFDPIKNEWTYVAEMRAWRYGLDLVTDGKLLFAVGGFNQRGHRCQCGDLRLQPFYTTVEVYDSTNDTWTLLEEPIYGRKGASAVLITP